MTQGELFPETHPLATAEARRDRALAQVAANAPDGWEDEARAWLEGFLQTHAEYFPDTDNRQAPEQPPNLKAWGVVVRWAIRARLIEPTNKCRPRTRGHCTPGRVYRSLLWRAEA